MKEKLEHTNQLVFRKITGELNQFEEIEFEKWLQETSENELLFRRMMDAYQKNQFAVRIKGQQNTFDKLSRQLDFEENIYTGRLYNQSSGSWNSWYRVAAVIIFFLVSVSIFYLTSSSTRNKQEIVQSELILKNNPAGQKTRISLPDGSVCWLNSESEIKFLSNFTESSRDIHLKGEAYFEVAKDKNRPFRVHAPAITITALGTIFNVNSFPDEQKETVTLIEGKISVNCEDKFFREILPGEAVSYDKEKKTSDRMKVDPDEAMIWKNGILQFKKETYQAVFSKLERWYGVKFRIIGNPTDDLKYSASFKNELLVNILKSISYGHEFEFKIDGKNVEIMFHKKGKTL